MILNALVEKLKRRSKHDFKGRHKGRHYEATLASSAPRSWASDDRDAWPRGGRQRRSSGSGAGGLHNALQAPHYGQA
jgi:hypothetical protein